MSKLSTLYRRLKFCMHFGATWKDSLRLILLTLNYNLSIRSKTNRNQLQKDLTIHTIEVNYNGKVFPLYFRRQDLSMLYEVWMDQSYLLDLTTVSDGHILDIGAHVGFTSLYFWTLLGDDRHYICIEGSDKNAMILKQNMSTIPYNTIYQHVITSDSRQVRFYDEMSGHLHQVHHTLGEWHHSTTMNSIFSNLKQREIALCKMDIEGMEYEILTQHNAWLDKISQLYLELHNPGEYKLIEACLSDYNLTPTISKGIVHFMRN